MVEKCETDSKKAVQDAVRWWTEAVQYQDQLVYMEPPFWSLSAHNCLGQLYLDRGQFDEAETQFAKDLAYAPKNGWALRGMIDALSGRRNKNAKVLEKYRKRFKKAWKYADTE